MIPESKTTSTKNTFQAFLSAVLSGLLLYFAAPGPGSAAPLAWIGLVPLFFACRRTSPGRAALLGLLTGLVHFALLLDWIMIVLPRYGGLPWWLAFPALVLLALYMALYTAGFTAGIRFFKDLPLVLSAPLLWTALDYLRGRLFSGFPWQDLAYSQYLHPLLIQTADIFGHYGVTFLIVLTNALIFTILTPRKDTGCRFRKGRAAIIAALCIVVSALAYDFGRLYQVKKAAGSGVAANIAVVQGNIAQEQKWLPDIQARTVNTYVRLSESALRGKKPALLVWPETALPFYIMENPLLARVTRLAESREVNLLTGAPHRERPFAGAPVRYYNSAVLITPEAGLSGKYFKQHLVPFGEYIPFRDYLSFLSPLAQTIGDFSPGPPAQPIPCQNLNIGVLICFESIFPELAREHAARGANLLVNLTNDAWYGRSNAPWQHLSMAVFRAVETRKSLARSANTGVSALVDPTGRLLEASPLFETSILRADLPLLAGRTFYVGYGHFFAPLCLGLVIVFAARGIITAHGCKKNKNRIG